MFGVDDAVAVELHRRGQRRSPRDRIGAEDVAEPAGRGVGVEIATTGVGASGSFLRTARIACMNSAGRATLTPRVPRTATAFRFFEPITAPTPDRPAARCLSLMMQAKRTRFSPAGPMQAMRVFGTPTSSRMPSSGWGVVLA